MMVDTTVQAKAAWAEHKGTSGFRQAVEAYPFARTALLVLASISLLAAFAPFLATYPNWYTNRDLAFSPPTAVHLTDGQGRFVWPYVHHHDRELDPLTGRPVYVLDPTVTYPLEFFVRSSNPQDRYVPFPVNLVPAPLRQLFGIDVQTSLRLVGVNAPRSEVPFYLLGSDIVGNCVLSSVLYGAQLSLAIGLIGSLVSLVLGLLLGVVVRAFGGWLDALVMSLYLVFSALPSVFLLLALLRYFDRIALPLLLAVLFLLVDAALIDLGTLGRTFRRCIRFLRERPEPALARHLDVRPPQSPFEHLMQHGLG